MRLGSTSFRTFVLYPVLVVAFELWLNHGRLRLQAWTLTLLAWGYLGHLIFLAGLALTLRSWFGAAIALGTAAWLQLRVRRDERRLGERFGEAYMQYCSRVKRWIPAVF